VNNNLLADSSFRFNNNVTSAFHSSFYCFFGVSGYFPSPQLRGAACCAVLFPFLRRLRLRPTLHSTTLLLHVLDSGSGLRRYQANRIPLFPPFILTVQFYRCIHGNVANEGKAMRENIQNIAALYLSEMLSDKLTSTR
jgi:hypothetical protein